MKNHISKTETHQMENKNLFFLPQTTDIVQFYLHLWTKHIKVSNLLASFGFIEFYIILWNISKKKCFIVVSILLNDNSNSEYVNVRLLNWYVRLYESENVFRFSFYSCLFDKMIQSKNIFVSIHSFALQ